jgi:alkanesulfonate monooxygenase SsuD/methylene tetrahydromethanopterin reductase-like flavin-dependent oxidoreductase (luciferase family)
VSAPEVVLAAIASKDRADSPRFSGDGAQHRRSIPRVSAVFHAHARCPSGRAEVILGRGSFSESSRLFGYDLSKYNALFEKKLAAFAKLLDQQPIVYPQIENGRLRTWVGVGGSPESVVRAARYGLPLTLAIIGGSAKRFLPYVDLYKRALKEFGKDPQRIGVHSPGHIAETDEQARAEVAPHYLAMMTRIGRERGYAGDDFERNRSGRRDPSARRNGRGRSYGR